MKTITHRQLAILRRILVPEVLNKLPETEQQEIRTLISEEGEGNHFRLFVDGAANLHLKAAGIGGHINKGSEEIYSFAEFVGHKTNNEAEYLALIRGIKMAQDLNITSLKIFADSELIVRQINGKYKVKHPNMIPLYHQVKKIVNHFSEWSIQHIPREKNSRADELSKEGLKKGIRT
ncbi:MAG: ribonuclease HI family protein [FCB group bacterium]|nr:ribonuclease HI family protein [FCB group bacterium]